MNLCRITKGRAPLMRTASPAFGHVQLTTQVPHGVSFSCFPVGMVMLSLSHSVWGKQPLSWARLHPSPRPCTPPSSVSDSPVNGARCSTACFRIHMTKSPQKVLVFSYALDKNRVFKNKVSVTLIFRRQCGLWKFTACLHRPDGGSLAHQGLSAFLLTFSHQLLKYLFIEYPPCPKHH